MIDKKYPTRMHEALGVETGELFSIYEFADDELAYVDTNGNVLNAKNNIPVGPYTLTVAINHGIIRKPRPGCWHCWNIEAHKIEYVTAVKDKDGRPMNTPVDIPYRYCPSCGRKLEVEG